MALVHLAVPHVQQQQPGECLAACAQMILTYLAIPVSYQKLLKLLRVKSGIGTPVAHLRSLKQLRVEAVYQQGNFDELAIHLRQGHPCIVFLKTGELSYWPEATDHAVVVVGLDEEYIYVNDPAFPDAPLQVDRGEFDLAWLEWDERYAVLIPLAR
ncbi:MAG: C39 family peptidase [Anaerolineae bacterium]|nr:C39 family peptidase [Anaerolineae bacterium]